MIFGLFGKPNVQKLKTQGDVLGLVNALRYQKDSRVVENARLALKEIGIAAVGPLVSAGRDIRTEVMWVLVEMDDVGIDGLAAVLKDKDRTGRMEAMDIVVAIMTDAFSWHYSEGKLELFRRRGIDLLAVALKDEVPEVREQAVDVMGDAYLREVILKDERGIDLLAAALKDEVPEVRKQAVTALGDITVHENKSRVLWLLAETLKDENPEVRLEAVNALEFKFTDDERTIDLLVAALKDEELYVRYHAVKALGEIKDERVVDLLIEVLKDENSWVRETVKELLIRRGCRSVVYAVEPIDHLYCIECGKKGVWKMPLGYFCSETCEDSYRRGLDENDSWQHCYNCGEGGLRRGTKRCERCGENLG